MKTWIKLGATLFVVCALYWATSAVFIVEAGESAIVTRFSRPLPVVYEPGPHLKAPWLIDAVIRIDRRLLVFRYREPTEFLTADKKNILVDSFAVWRVDDPHRFLATVRNRDGAEARMLDAVTAALGEVIGRYPLDKFINPDPAEVKLEEINDELTTRCISAARQDYGIEVVEVRINAFNFPPQNRASVIKRMRAEREHIATEYRSQGDEEAAKIEAQTELEARTILAKAERRAAVARGRGEAEAIKTSGKAYAADPDFYRFLRTLEAYDRIVDENTTLVLSSDSELWRLLAEGAP